MVPPGGSAYILQNNRLSVQHVDCYIHIPRQWKETKILPLYPTKYQQRSITLTTVQSLSQSEPWCAHSFTRLFSTRRPLWHSRINLLFAPLPPCPFTPLSTCCNAILLSSSSHWTFPRRSTPSDTPGCCPSWLNSTSDV